MATFDVDVGGATYEVDAPDEKTAWKWANATHAKSTPAKPEYVTGHNLAMGALKSAADIGTTLLRPIDAALNFTGITDKTNVQRKADINQFFGERADPESLEFKGGELLTDIAGTAGIGGILSKAAKGLGAGPKIVNALQSGGFNLGGKAAGTPAGKAADMALRVGAGAAGGGAAAGLVGEDAGTGAMIGGALPPAVAGFGKAGQLVRNVAGAKGVNPVLQQTLQEAQKAGYVVPPSMAGAGTGSRVLEGLSGKFKTNQLAGIKNQSVTDDLARTAIGLPKGTPLTSDAVQAVRQNAYKAGYEPIASISTPLTPAANYAQALDDVAKQYSGPAKSFPGVAKADVDELISTFKGVQSFGADDALGAIQILRNNASDAFRAGNNAMGKAQREIAEILEDQIEQSLSAVSKGAQAMNPVKMPNGQTVYMTGKDMLKNFRDARTLMAKAHTVEDAIREGGGMVDAKVIAREFQRNPKRLSGELETIGKFANNFGDVAGVPKSGNANPFTVLDFFTGGVGAGAGAAPLMALPLARVGARQSILSKPFQQQFVSGAKSQPQLTNKLRKMLENPATRNALIQASQTDQ
jgi:hypothetical protein